MSMRRGSFRKITTALLTATLALGLLAGCSGGKAVDKEQEKVLRIGVLYGGTMIRISASNIPMSMNLRIRKSGSRSFRPSIKANTAIPTARKSINRRITWTA